MQRLSDCRKTSLKKINGVWGEAPSKVAGAAAPDNKPLPEGKGFGDGDREFVLLIKKIDFFDKLRSSARICM